jgi:hypothetical protein
MFSRVGSSIARTFAVSSSTRSHSTLNGGCSAAGSDGGRGYGRLDRRQGLQPIRIFFEEVPAALPIFVVALPYPDATGLSARGRVFGGSGYVSGLRPTNGREQKARDREQKGGQFAHARIQHCLVVPAASESSRLRAPLRD